MAIIKNYEKEKTEKDQEEKAVNIQIIKTPRNELRISVGAALGFVPKDTIIISKEKPELLWNLLYEYADLPFPKIYKNDEFLKKISERKETEKESQKDTPEKNNKNLLKEELKSMRAADIVEKVRREKGVEIRCSLKSKSTIIKQALQIYGE